MRRSAERRAAWLTRRAEPPRTFPKGYVCGAWGGIAVASGLAGLLGCLLL